MERERTLSQKKRTTIKRSKTKASTVLKKKPTETWACPEGCKPGRTPCPHLEKLVGESKKQPQYESTQRYVDMDIEKAYYESGAGYVIPDNVSNRHYEYKFREKMEATGLEPVYVDILTLRFVYDMDLADIAEDLGIVSSSLVLTLLNKALAVVKEKGIKK